MMKVLFITILYAISFKIALYGGIIIGTINDIAIDFVDSPVVICSGNENLYYPSRVIDAEKIKRNYVIYNLHIAYLDSCSNPQIKTIQVPIPTDLHFVQCAVGSEYEYYFEGDERFVIVIVPATASDTLSSYFYSDLFQNTRKGQETKLLKGNYQKGRVRPNYYVGALQTGAYTLSYFNFNKKQNNQYKKILGR